MSRGSTENQPWGDGVDRYFYNDWPAYVPVAERRRQAAKKIAKMEKAGQNVSPIKIEGRRITGTFWGDAWCKNLEGYADYSNRLPRGRTYVRNGSVVDLQIGRGRVRALVSGTDFYRVDIKIDPLAKKRWTQIKGQCAGQIDSLVELLQGSISRRVMEIVTRRGEGLFPAPHEITLSCSCPDWADMCKHVAATLYGVGARLDHQPELLFPLRGVDAGEMLEAAVDRPLTGKPHKGRALQSDELSSVFGIDIEIDGVSAVDASTTRAAAKRKTRAAPARKKPVPRPRKKKVATKSVPKKKKKKSAAKKGAAKKGAAKKGAAKKGAAKKRTRRVR